ncbi:MAG: ATP-binding cassette domain-containing protein, partial [Bryobacteraceae bacterium]
MISCRNLQRRFGSVIAVADLSLDIPAGAICAILGPNGAGKSTTLKMLTGLLAPTAGEAFVAGVPVGIAPRELR